MKKAYPYIIGGAVLLLLLVALIASRSKPLRRMDERITLRQRDKIPYGTTVAHHLLPSLFPQAAIYSDARYPGSWEHLDLNRSKQAVILIADYFNADEDELERLNHFVANGNFVFLVARTFSDVTARFLRLDFSSYYNFYTDTEEDSMYVKLEKPSFATDSFYTYPGRRYEGRIQKMEIGKAVRLGRNEHNAVNFIQLKKGEGRFFVHTSPLAFSNYFILHKQNVAYYQQVMSVIPNDVKVVLWTEYFLEKLRNPSDREDTNWLGALLKVTAFRWGLLTALAFLLLYILLGMRRKQRVIPPHEKPVNDSLDFVRTLGRLYFDRGDHANLAEKMSAYFLEHVRSTYKIPTHTLDEEFIKTLHAKSGYPEPEVNKIVSEITQLKAWPEISEERLAGFHKSLELFYQNT